MSKTWLLRGVAVAIFVVLVGSWGVGLVDLGDTPSSSGEGPSTPVPPPPDSEPASYGQLSNVLEKANRRRSREAGTTEAALTEPSTTAADPTDDGSGSPTPTSTAPSPDPSDPSEHPGSPTPPPSSSNPPSEPAGECTDLAAVVDCALDPITGRP